MSYNSQPEDCDHLLVCRGLCSVGVLVAHVLTWNFGLIPGLQATLAGSGNRALAALAAVWPSTGGNFVEVFFVLSGYLMGKIFWEGRYSVERASVRRFYKNRLLRIAPLFYFSLLLLVCLGGRFYNALGDPLSVLGDLLFLNNLTGRSINAVTWSLSYEMQYYLVCPFVFMLLSRATARTTLLAFGLAGLLFCISVLHAALGQSLLLTPFNFAWLFVGGYAINLVVRQLHEGRGMTRGRAATVLGYLAFIAAHAAYYALANSAWSDALRPFAGHMASLALFACAAVSLSIFELPERQPAERRPGLIPRAFTWGGRVSYGVYLWHLPVLLSLLGSESAAPVGRKLLSLLAPLQNAPLEHLLFALCWLLAGLVLVLALSTATFFLVETGFRPNLYSPRNGQ